MLIPLDYYRILGVPIQATADQLQQAHRDRSRQKPRREYSQVSIAKRKELIDEAFAVLSDVQQRTRYDASFLAKTYDLDSLGIATSNSENGTSHSVPSPGPQTPSIEIEDDRLVGALLILQELGEYELVLKLGRLDLSSPKNSPDELSGTIEVIRSDIVLTVANAYLELGREQWQQSQYENAAAALEAGQALLLRESLFPNLRGEMQADLYKLRPYRILELLTLPQEQSVNRQRGLQLLRDMLNERGGIDGTGDDRSGLDVDDFLRFIQQLRPHTTAAEQQLLFEREARRPSAVATYLAVYAMIARGFAHRKPALIHRAQLMLIQLGRRQDVHLERAIGSLLLGQTETASRALELSQEEEALAFIREQSRDSEDLLPGLCLYGERWLQEEVFPHFRDLADQRASLKEYFADEQVQAHLEALPTEDQMSNQWVVSDTATAAPEFSQPEPMAEASNPAASATLTASRSASVSQGVDVELDSARQPTQGQDSTLGLPSLPLEETNPFGGSEGMEKEVRNSRRPGRSPQWGSVKVKRLALVGLVGLAGLGLVGFLALKILGGLAGWVRGLSSPSLVGEQLSIRLDRPLLEIAASPSTQAANAGPLNKETARQIVETWLSAKKAALGSGHQIDRLSEILVSPALENWQLRAQSAKNDGVYLEYEHNVTIESASVDETDENRATVEATVRESETVFQEGQPLDASESELKLSYELLRQNDRWLIQNWTWEVLN